MKLKDRSTSNLMLGSLILISSLNLWKTYDGQQDIYELNFRIEETKIAIARLQIEVELLAEEVLNQRAH